MAKHYSIACYDKHLCLKPSIAMWLILLFLSRSYLVLVLSVVNRKDRTALIDMVYPDRLAMSLGALAGVPAVFLIYAWAKRQPGAPPLARKAWAHGRALLAASALLNASMIFTPLLLGTARVLHWGDWAQLAISLFIVGVVYRSPYIRDCFNDFPSEEQDADRKQANSRRGS